MHVLHSWIKFCYLLLAANMPGSTYGGEPMQSGAMHAGSMHAMLGGSMYSDSMRGWPAYGKTIDSETIKEAFKRYMIVPQCIPNAPKDKFSAIFTTIEMDFGNFIHPFDTIDPAYITYPASSNSLYTLIYFDPDQPFLYQPFGGQLLQALVVNIPGTDVQKGERIGVYVPTIPYPGSGPHRCVYLIYKQPGKIIVNVDLRISVSTNLTSFNMFEFAQRYKLGDPVAGNFYISELTQCEPNQDNTCSKNFTMGQ